MTGTLRLLVALGIIVGSFVLGALIAAGCGCRTTASGSAWSLFTLVASMAIVYFGWPPKRGIDLSGGVVLVYEVDTALTELRLDAVGHQAASTRSSTPKAASGSKPGRSAKSGSKSSFPPASTRPASKRRSTNLRESADDRAEPESQGPKDGQTVLVYRADPAAAAQLDMAKLIARRRPPHQSRAASRN